MSGTTVSASVLAGAGEAVRLYLRMPAGAEADAVSRAAAAACESAQAVLGVALAEVWENVPAAVAQAIVLLAAELVEHREEGAARLLRPFRAVRLLPDAARGTGA